MEGGQPRGLACPRLLRWDRFLHFCVSQSKQQCAPDQKHMQWVQIRRFNPRAIYVLGASPSSWPTPGRHTFRLLPKIVVFSYKTKGGDDRLHVYRSLASAGSLDICSPPHSLERVASQENTPYLRKGLSTPSIAVR